MMMSKPSAATAAESNRTVGGGSTTTTNGTNTKPADAVAELERRLAQLGSAGGGSTVASGVGEGMLTPPTSMAFALPPTTTTTNSTAPTTTSSLMPASTTGTTTASTAGTGGKNALLARILAAQEKAKQGQPNTNNNPPPTTTTAAVDLLSGDLLESSQPPPPAFEEHMAPPPPAFDDCLIPPQTLPSKPAQTMDSIFTWDPHAPPPPPSMMMDPPPSIEAYPSAPDFQDILLHEAPLPPPAEASNTVDLATAGLDDEAIAAVLGMEGLSMAEKQALIEEQRKIMEAIQQGQKQQAASQAHSAADAFEARSFSANVAAAGRSTMNAQPWTLPGRLQGPERTHQAISNGTALTVQCINCQNWMHITREAQLMKCPLCSTVQQPMWEATMTAEEMAQMKADMELAERLQQEEYAAAAEEREQRQARRTLPTGGTSPAAATTTAAKPSHEQSWLEWMGLASSSSNTTTTTTTTTASNQATVPERPSPTAARSPGAGQRPVRGYEDNTEEYIPQRARVAESAPLFSCVADSISTALTTAIQGPPPEGVDHTSLLAMPDTVGRRQDSTDEGDHGGTYDRDGW